MHEALNVVVQKDRQTETCLKKSKAYKFFFFQVFQMSSLLQLLNTAAGTEIQGQYCDPRFVCDAFAFCPGCWRSSLTTSVAPSRGGAGSSCDPPRPWLLSGRRKTVCEGIRTQLQGWGVPQSSSDGTAHPTMNHLFSSLSPLSLVSLFFTFYFYQYLQALGITFFLKMSRKN